jgi:hypothetical protein
MDAFSTHIKPEYRIQSLKNDNVNDVGETCWGNHSVGFNLGCFIFSCFAIFASFLP